MNIISNDLKNQLIQEGINPNNVKEVSSKYKQKSGAIVTTVTLNDGSNHFLVSEPAWYAARKNKRW